MKITGFVFIIIFTFLIEISGQKFLLIERSGTPRTQRFGLYDQLTFQLRDDTKGWYTRQILDMNPDARLILLGDTWFSTDDIFRIRMSRKRVLASIIGGALQGGGVSMMLGDAWYTIRGHSRYTQGGLEFGALNIAVGSAVRALLGPVKYKLGKMTRLRVIDTTVGK